MSLAHIYAEPSSPTDYLGPATVVDVTASTVQVTLRDGTKAPATMALAFPYAPSVDDVLLVIGRHDEHYVIGVIQGRGRVSMRFDGDVELRSEGQLELSGGKGVRVRGPEVALEAGKLQMAADSLKQRFGQVYQRVSSLLSVKAGRQTTTVEGDVLTRAKNATILTDQAMAINGKAVHLG